MTRPVEIHINELVLHGFPAADRYRIAEAIQRELARLITADGIPASISVEGEIPRVGGEFTMPAGSNADQIGYHVARTVYGGLNE